MCILTHFFIVFIKYAVTFSSWRGRKGGLWFFLVWLSSKTLRPSVFTWSAAGRALVTCCSSTPGATSVLKMMVTRAASASVGTRAATFWMWPSLSWGSVTQATTTVSFLWPSSLLKTKEYVERPNSSSLLMLVSCIFFFFPSHFILQTIRPFVTLGRLNFSQLAAQLPQNKSRTSTHVSTGGWHLECVFGAAPSLPLSTHCLIMHTL